MSIRGSLNRRNSGPSDWPDIESVYAGAFPDEDLLPVVRELLEVPEIATSLVAEIDARVVGHVMFSRCAIEGTEIEVSLLAPLAVAPEWHGQGIGSDLVRYGLQRLADEGVHLVCVLGDPAFYGRLGFVNQVCGVEEFDKVVDDCCERILRCAPLSIAASKEAIMRGLDEPSLADAMANQDDYPAFHRWRRSEDAREGPRAFAEKRAPVWQGR